MAEESIHRVDRLNKEESKRFLELKRLSEKRILEKKEIKTSENPVLSIIRELRKNK